MPARSPLLLPPTLALGLTGCGGETPPPAPPAAPPAVWLRDVGVERGFAPRHESGAAGSFHLPEIMGAGVALFDAEDDGDLDAYLICGNELLPAAARSSRNGNRFYRQEDGGRFVDASAASGLDDGGFGMGVAIADADNDGDVDLWVSNFGRDSFYRNAGDGSFVDDTGELSVEGLSTSCAFTDLDLDGHLDLYVARFVRFDPARRCFDDAGAPDYCGPLAYEPDTDVVLRNLGDGTFEDVTARLGVAAVRATGLGVTCADFDGDGWQDVYVANDGYANFLWLNQEGRRFEESAYLWGVALNRNGQPEAGMGVVAEDFDADGKLDLFMTHLKEESNTMYLSGAASQGMQDVTAARGLGASSMPFTGFGVAAVDLDADGVLDLLVANGGVRKGQRFEHAPAGRWEFLAEPNLVYRGLPGARFEDASALARAFVEPPEVSRGLAVGDVDGDGDEDVLLGNVGGAARLLLNEAPQGHWLRVRCHDPRWNRAAVGAAVLLEPDEGAARLRVLGGGGSYVSAAPLEVHFGLGTAATYRGLRVRWPGGPEERFPGGPADRTLTLVRGQGEKL